MKDFDIKIKGKAIVTLYGTDNGTIVIPAECKIDNSGRSCDIDIKGSTDVAIGIPNVLSGIELAIEDSEVTITNISYESLEIDVKGNVKITAGDVNGKLDINMRNGEAELVLPESYSFRTLNEGRGTSINNLRTEDPSSTNIIEINGKDSVLNIR